MAGRACIENQMITDSTCAHFLRLPDGELRHAFFEAMSKGGHLIRDEAERRAPKREGFLKASIVVWESEKWMSVKVIADYPATGRVRKAKKRKKRRPDANRDYYAMAVEYGTRKDKAQPFFFPAVEAKKGQVCRMVQSAMEKVVEK